MLRIEIGNAKPGMRLAQQVEHLRKRGHILLRTGYTLDPESIRRLQQLEVRSVWVHYPSLDFICQFVDQRVLSSQKQVVDKICDTFETLQQGTVAMLPYAMYTQSISQLISCLLENPKSAVFMGDLLHNDDNDLMRHSSCVTYLSLLMGLKLESYIIRQRRHLTPAKAKKVANLGLGAMLHDIGITLLDNEARKRYETTRNESDPEWQEHPSLGYEMMRGNVDPSAATVILNHHQRCDGSGYAGKDRPVLEGQRFHVFARIVALAEQFDRILHPMNEPARPAAFGLATMLQPDMLPKFDPQVIRALLAIVPPYPPGSVVQLNDKRWAAVIDHNLIDPCRPVVQIIPDPNDLAPQALPPNEPIELASLTREEMFICTCDGHDVSDLNFTVPDLHRPEFASAVLV